MAKQNNSGHSSLEVVFRRKNFEDEVKNKRSSSRETFRPLLVLVVKCLSFSVLRTQDRSRTMNQNINMFLAKDLQHFIGRPATFTRRRTKYHCTQQARWWNVVWGPETRRNHRTGVCVCVCASRNVTFLHSGSWQTGWNVLQSRRVSRGESD